MIKLIKAHPLLSVLLAALAVRLLAVVWSQGFIHSDDYYDTIVVAWDWLHHGMFGADGFLRWKWQSSDMIGRFPLYTLALLGQIKLCHLLGMSSLGSIMYTVRLSHALISLLPVGVMFIVIRQVTGSVRWGVIGGLVAGFHFALPFLGVRNLIEVVGGNIWIVAIGMLYLYRRKRAMKWVYLAGVVTGLAWMIRFQLAFAVVPVPFLLWWESRDWRVAARFSVAVAGMVLVAGVVDWWLLGRFAGSSLAYLSMNAGYGALYNTIPLLYPLLLMLLLVPPFSFPALWTAFRPTFMKDHAVLIGSSVSFLVIHWLHPHQQERFIFPILPAFLLVAILAIWQLSRDRNFEIWSRKGWRWVIGVSVVLNLLLLPALTFAYGHKGMIEPLRWFERNEPEARVLFLQPGAKRWVPIEYGGGRITRFYVRKWSDLQSIGKDSTAAERFDFFVVYPKRPDDLPRYLDSLNAHFGELDQVMEFPPSAYDWTLHVMNPGHNDNFAAFVYRPARVERPPAVEAGE